MLVLLSKFLSVASVFFVCTPCDIPAWLVSDAWFISPPKPHSPLLLSLSLAHPRRMPSCIRILGWDWTGFTPPCMVTLRSFCVLCVSLSAVRVNAAVHVPLLRRGHGSLRRQADEQAPRRTLRPDVQHPVRQDAARWSCTSGYAPDHGLLSGELWWGGGREISLLPEDIRSMSFERRLSFVVVSGPLLSIVHLCFSLWVAIFPVCPVVPLWATWTGLVFLSSSSFSLSLSLACFCSCLSFVVCFLVALSRNVSPPYPPPLISLFSLSHTHPF